MTKNRKVVKKNTPAKGKARTSATSAAILGGGNSAASNKTSKQTFVPRKAKIKPQWTKYYANLLELRERLLHQMNGLAKETAEALPGYSLHMADSGTDNFDRDFALSLLSSDQDAIYEIEEALKRIEKNTYGVCELTGKSIPKARLAAIPWTRFTVEAQGQLEKEGALRSRKLGQLGTIDNSGGSDAEGGDEEEGEEKPAKEKE